MKGSGKKAKPKKSLTPSSSPLHPSTSSHTLELSPEGTILLPVIVQSDLPPNELYLSPSLVQSLDLLPACYIALTFPNGQSILTRLSTASKGLASFAEYKRVAVLNKIWTPNLICAVEGLEEGDRSITLDMALLKRYVVDTYNITHAYDIVDCAFLFVVMLILYFPLFIRTICLFIIHIHALTQTHSCTFIYSYTYTYTGLASSPANPYTYPYLSPLVPTPYPTPSTCCHTSRRSYWDAVSAISPPYTCHTRVTKSPLPCTCTYRVVMLM